MILKCVQDLNNNNRKDIMDTEDRLLEVMNWRFYFVKLHKFRNPDLIQIEELLDLRFVISQTREEVLSRKDRLQSNLQNPSYYNIHNWNLMKDGLRTLRLCIEDRIRVQFGTSGKKAKEAECGVFPHLHGCSNLAKERKTVKRMMNEAQCDAFSNPSWEDYDQIMQRLEFSLVRTRHDPCNRRDEILLDIGELRRAKEEALSNASRHQVGLPESVSREEVEKKIKGAIELLEDRRARLMEYDNEFAVLKEELLASVKYLLHLDKQLSDLDMMQTSYRSLPEWRKQHQAENASHDKNVSLLRHAGKLADMKDTAALMRLSEGQVEEFMGRWNEDAVFRCDYQRRAQTSLNSRGLCADGRTRNPNEGMIVLDGPRIKLSSRIRKLLKKKPASMVLQIISKKKGAEQGRPFVPRIESERT